MEACRGSVAGGGAFAFVTQKGVELFLEDIDFVNFATHGNFELVVGIDEITDHNTLNRLNNLCSRISGLKVSAFFHNISSSLFHPKFCWFKHTSGGVLVVGSGNLTTSGLRKNWEAFGVFRLNDTQLSEIEIIWHDWLIHNETRLKPINDPDVVTRATLNVMRPRAPITESPISLPEVSIIAEPPEDSAPWEFVESDEVLIAEIPNSGDRWQQANFSKEIFIRFFGATPGDNSQRMLFRNVLQDGKLAEIEKRTSVSVRSRNYRFELHAAAGLAYPGDGPPIGIFIRVSSRMFIYVLIFPGANYYDEIRTSLDATPTSRSGAMRRKIITVNVLRSAYPNLPFWRLVDPANH